MLLVIAHIESNENKQKTNIKHSDFRHSMWFYTKSTSNDFDFVCVYWLDNDSYSVYVVSREVTPTDNQDKSFF